MPARLACLAALVALLAAPSALADGDPASDTLLVQNVFLPYPAPSGGAGAALESQVAAVYTRGDRLKVAVVASKTDLGAIPSLFDHPADYAKFLGTEIKFDYVGPLLIVMPSGFGIYDGGRATTAEDRVLASARVAGSSADELTASATSAVARLEAANALRSKDILAPVVYAIQGHGARGTTMKLQFQLSDDSGKASALIQLKRTGGVVATIRLPLRPTAPVGALSSVPWRVPRSLAPGPLRFCITAADPSGNRARDCQPVLIS